MILGYEAFVLIDSGSTCSFISYEFILKVHGIIEPLEYNICVTMPAGGTMIVNMVIKA